MDFPGLNVTKYHNILLPSLSAAHEMKCLPLNVGPVVLKNHTGPKDVAHGALLGTYTADQTMNNGPESQYLALKPQLMELSNVYNDSKNDWVMVKKNAGGYISQLKMDDKDKNPQGRRCYNCRSPDHYKKQRPKKKAAGIEIIYKPVVTKHRGSLLRKLYYTRLGS